MYVIIYSVHDFEKRLMTVLDPNRSVHFTASWPVGLISHEMRIGRKMLKLRLKTNMVVDSYTTNAQESCVSTR